MHRFQKIVVFLFPIYLFAQDFGNQWTGHYSYFQINDLFTSGTQIYAASENSVFVYNPDSQTSETFSTVNGLSGEEISKVYYSEVYDTIVIGYKSGLLELILSNGNVRTFIDIPEKPTIPLNQKRINHFYENGENLYISTAFGIVVFNLEKIEFGDTFIIGSGGALINITGTLVQGESIYATSFMNGIYVANVNSTNLIDFNQWTQVVPGEFKGIEEFGGNIFVWQDEIFIRQLNGSDLVDTITTTSPIERFSANSQNLTLTLIDRSLIYDTSLQEMGSIISTNDNTFVLNSSVALDNKVYLGTRTKGLLEVDINNISTNISVSPKGPLLNSPFAIEALNNNLWVVFGDYTFSFNPFPIKKAGISRLNNGSWQNISKDDVLGATSLCRIGINPENEEQVYVCSFQEGLLEIENNEVVNLYNSTNSGFETIIPEVESTRLNGAEFDRNGNLWILNTRISNGLKRFSPETKEIFNVNLNSVIPDPDNNIGFSDLALDGEGNAFFGGWNIGVVGYNASTGRFVQLLRDANLPSDYISSLEVDRNNQLWIGTFRGLRILFNASGVFSQSNPSTSNIVILDNEGVPQELLFDQNITDIEVDGSNNKWVSTASSGVFYFSPDGQKTLAHFTKSNSPLPSNNVLDISVDDSTGSVYFATAKGLLEFKGTATGPEEDLNNVAAFPNPVRPGFNGRVTINGLTGKANVKITDIEGNLVYEEVSQGGSIQWDTTAFGRHKVASGVYLILVTSDDQSETTVSKLLIVR